MAQPFNVEPRIDIDAAAFCLDTTLWTSEQLGAFVELMATLVVSRDRAGFEAIRPPWVTRVRWGYGGRPYIPVALRRRVFARDGYACIGCGAVSGLSIDHAVPVSAGGRDTFDNLQAMCRACNRLKWNR
jgi:hypothetical protein